MSKIEVNTVDTQCGTNLTVGAACKSVTVAGNDVRSNTYKAADGGSIISQSGTTITIGASGDTVSLASGASQSGFGRSGSVDWQTTIKTANFTAASGEGYFCNTSGGAFTLTLPSSPSVGDIVALKDYGSAFATNNLTIGRGGSNMNGSATDFTAATNDLSLTLVYADSTKGWLSVEEGTGFIGENYVEATGGTITTSGNYKIHTFTGPGTFCVSSLAGCSANNKVDYVVVAGGGAGYAPDGGGGGAGGYRESPGTTTCYTASPLGTSPAAALPVTATGYPVTVGAGAASNSNGSNSVFSGSSTITSTGGGRGGSYTNNGNTGGAGGGGGRDGAAGGAGNTPPVSPPQGKCGGFSNVSCGANQDWNGGGGGGGATAPGGNGTGNGSPGPEIAGPGGAGATTQIPGSPLVLAGGGGGALNNSGSCSSNPTGPRIGTGGAGGGGRGSLGPGVDAVAGTANTGGGGGGSMTSTSGLGGSGIVIIRYKYQ